MAFELPKISYSGSILEVTVGQGDKAITVGGENSYPFHTWEGSMPKRPVLAMEVWDMEPEDWPEACSKPFEGVLGDPGAWAKKCVDEFGAEAIVLQLKSTDPNGEDAPPEKASEAVGKVLGAVDVPVIIWGSANANKDAEVLKKIAEFPDVLSRAAESREPHHDAYYVRELAGLWNPYVQDRTRHRVLSDDASLTSARLGLTLAVRTVVANALALLGISAPERM